MADKSPLPPVPPGVVQGYSDGFEYVAAHDGHPSYVMAFPHHWFLDNQSSLPFHYRASLAKPTPLWWLNPISFTNQEWKPIRGKYCPHVGGFAVIQPVSDVVLMTMADFYKITPATKAIRTYAVYQAEWRCRQSYNPHMVYVLGLEYMSGERQALASQLGGSDKLAHLVEPLRKQFGVGRKVEAPAGLVGWCENVSEGAKVRERRRWAELETVVNLTLDHWLLTITEDRMIYRSRPVHSRPDFAVTGPRDGLAAHYPVVWDVALDDVRTVEVRKLSEFVGDQYKQLGHMGVVEGPDEYLSWTRARNFGDYHRFWKLLAFDMPREAWEARPRLDFVFNYDEWNVLFAFMQDGSRRVIWQTFGKNDWMMKQQATIAGHLEKAKAARSSGKVEEQDRRNYL